MPETTHKSTDHLSVLPKYIEIKCLHQAKKKYVEVKAHSRTLWEGQCI